MPLSEFKAITREVKFPGGSMQVRAVSLPDVSMLIDSHEQTINDIVQKVRKGIVENGMFEDEEVMASVLTDVFMQVIRESPVLIGNIISLCADEPGLLEIAMKLPVSVQIEALIVIGELSFVDLASVKKFAADVMKLIRNLLPSELEALAVG